MCPLDLSEDKFQVNSFYSYKGGAGRSLTTINALAAIVKNKKNQITSKSPILLIDMDVDSAGISYLCGAQNRINKSNLTSKVILTNEIDFSGRNQLNEVPKLFREVRKTLPISLAKKMHDSEYTEKVINWLSEKDLYFEVVDFLESNYENKEIRMALNSCKSITELMYEIEKRADWKCLMDISYVVGADEPESVLFLGADILCGIAFTYSTNIYEDTLIRFLGQCKRRGFHSVFIDSASGRQTIAQVAHNVSDKLIMCLRMTTQFQEGTFNYLQYSCKKESDRYIILLPVAVPQNNINRIKNAKLEIKIRWDKLLKSDLNVDKNKLIYTMVEYGGVPEVEVFKWKEQVLALKEENELSEDEKLAIDAFNKLSEIIEGE